MRIFCLLSLALIFVFANRSYGQDERLWRKILTGDVIEDEKKAPVAPKYVFAGATYRLDLDGDGKLEGIQMVKNDLLDAVEIFTPDGRRLFRGDLEPQGVLARVERLRLVDLSPQTRVLIIHYYEGKTEGRRMEATARLWFLTWPKTDLSQMTLTKGPGYWHEFEGVREQYGRRLYSVNVRDYDNDGTKDIAVAFNNMMSVWRYKRGQWKSF
jgi:hypothetical protein